MNQQSGPASGTRHDLHEPTVIADDPVDHGQPHAVAEDRGIQALLNNDRLGRCSLEEFDYAADEVVDRHRHMLQFPLARKPQQLPRELRGTFSRRRDLDGVLMNRVSGPRAPPCVGFRLPMTDWRSQAHEYASRRSGQRGRGDALSG